MDGAAIPGEIAVWWMELEAPPATVMAQWRACLDAAEQAQADRFHFEEDRSIYTAAHWLTRNALASVGGYQVAVLFLCMLVAALDGFDTQAIGYTAPAIAGMLKLPMAEFGKVGSAGLVGAAPIALDQKSMQPDRLGRIARVRDQPGSKP